jgi:hypothetical protein
MKVPDIMKKYDDLQVAESYLAARDNYKAAIDDQIKNRNCQVTAELVRDYKENYDMWFWEAKKRGLSRITKAQYEKIKQSQQIPEGEMV